MPDAMQAMGPSLAVLPGSGPTVRTSPKYRESQTELKVLL